MPPRSTRRTSGGPTAAKTKAQSTIAFHGRSNRITKPVAQPGKTKKDPAVVEGISRNELQKKTEDEVDPDLEKPTTAEVASEEQAEAEVEAQVDEHDELARKVSEAQIKKYWRAKEEERKAPRVHQEGLSLREKVCREFDTDGRFGPCMGVSRIQRWKRAKKLGLEPPMEVLAVLLREEEEGNGRAQRAYMDELMSSRTVVET